MTWDGTWISNWSWVVEIECGTRPLRSFVWFHGCRNNLHSSSLLSRRTLLRTQPNSSPSTTQQYFCSKMLSRVPTINCPPTASLEQTQLPKNSWQVECWFYVFKYVKSISNHLRPILCHQADSQSTRAPRWLHAGLSLLKSHPCVKPLSLCLYRGNDFTQRLRFR